MAKKNNTMWMIVSVVVFCLLAYVVFMTTNKAKEHFAVINAGGSWDKTCKNIKVINLNADCQKMKGRYVNTSINLSNCASGKLKNINGVLKCE